MQKQYFCIAAVMDSQIAVVCVDQDREMDLSPVLLLIRHWVSQSFLSDGNSALESSHSKTKKCEAEWSKVACVTWKADLIPLCWTGSWFHGSVRSPTFKPPFLLLLHFLVFPARPYQNLCKWFVIPCARKKVCSFGRAVNGEVRGSRVSLALMFG